VEKGAVYLKKWQKENTIMGLAACLNRRWFGKRNSLGFEDPSERGGEEMKVVRKWRGVPKKIVGVLLDGRSLKPAGRT